MKRFQLFFLLLLCAHSSLLAQCDPLRDSLALVDFHKNTLDFFLWQNQTNWLVEGQAIETWYGVTTNNQGCVTQLKLPDNTVASSIPSSIGDLSELEILDLSHNPIHNISTSIGNLSKLRILKLNGTSTDDLPQNFENLQNLEILDLSSMYNSDFSTIPPEVLKLRKLKSFKMNSGGLVGTIPPDLVKLPNLDTLWLHRNTFEGCIPEAFRSLCSSSVQLYGNPLLPWQGDFDSFCNSNSQIGALCNNGAIASCLISRINSACECVTDTTISYPNPIVDSLALVDLFYTNNGIDWDNKTNWLVRGQAIGTWYGVTTNEEGYVSCLDLDGDPECNWQIIDGVNQGGGNSLRNELPNSIGCFSELTFLSIAGDLVWGGLPNSIGKLKKMKTLNISNTNISGIPTNINELSELESLVMINNRLEGELPNTIGLLPNLKQLSFAQNNLLGDNKSLPTSLSNLTKLETLQFDRCRFSGELPDFIGDLPFINIVRLSGNDFSGCFPNSYANLCGIEHVDFTGNPKLPWEGAFDGFCNKNNQIGALCDDGDASTNSIINDVCFCSDPDILTNETDSLALVALFNSTNGLAWDDNENWLVVGAPVYTWEGVFLDENGRVINIHLYKNNLNGTLPPEIGLLSELERLQLSSNDLSGTLPPEIGQLSNLKRLQLSSNDLSGILPLEISQLSQLKELRLSANNFSGKIPNEIGLLAQLEKLYLDVNNFSGRIPNEIGLLSKLEKLDLGSNMLEGKIPSEIGLLTKLTDLSLGHNKLSGEIPSELGNLENMEEMHLSVNNLHGCIPENLTSLSNVFVSIWGNPMLPWGGDFSRFRNGETQIGAFCDDGNPSTINDIINDDCSCGNTCNKSDSLALVELYKTTNGEHWLNTWDLTTSYTTWFGVSTNESGCVDGLTLINNNLDGSLPNSLVGLSNLEILILDNNNLVGTIPNGFGNIEPLQVFRLNNNNLNGCFPDDLLSSCDFISASFTNNPLLPWEGDFERFCSDEEPISAKCDEDVATSIIENNWMATFDVYPNPTTSTINFDFQEYMNLSSLSCTNVWGQNIAVDMTIKNDLVTLDMSNLPSGVYFLSILGEQKAYISKLVVQ